MRLPYLRKKSINSIFYINFYTKIKCISQDFQGAFSEKVFCTKSITDTRHNEINLQMLSKNLYNQIFGNSCNSYNNLGNISDIESIKQELSNFGIKTKYESVIPEVDIKIPKLQGENIQEHFKQIAYDQVQPYIKIINKLLNELPPMPQNFILNEGWTRYTSSGYESIEFPAEDGLIFDVEVCMKNGPLPTLATAVSATNWYCWVSKDLIEESSNLLNKNIYQHVLIPLESSRSDDGMCLNRYQQMPKIVVGHNVSFDRIRIKEQYWLERTSTRFLDTMALHNCVSGTSSYQRLLLKSKTLSVDNDHLNSITSLNNLADVYNLYCGLKLNKTKKDMFLHGDLSLIKSHFNESVLYCALDVVATHEVLKKIFPLFKERFPHPATLAGMLELSTTYLPVNYNWKRYLEEANTTYEDLNVESKICLSKRANEVCRLQTSDKFKKDPWMWNEDWSTKRISLKKHYEVYDKKLLLHKNTKLKLKFEYFNSTKSFLPKKVPYLPGYPNWYRKLYQKHNFNIKLFPEIQNISTSMLIAPKILNLTWENYPLYHIKNFGWGFLVPLKSENLKKKCFFQQIMNVSLNKQLKIENKNPFLNTAFENEVNLGRSDDYVNVNANLRIKPDTISDSCFFFKLPHKNGTSFNVGNPLSKDFLNKFSENILCSTDTSASRILEISKMSSYWKNNRDRITSQLVVWLSEKRINLSRSKDVSKRSKSVTTFGAIIPQVVVSGTLTRRAVESTWMTASNAQGDRIGSELRAMINAPPNYNIIGADVDSQELWIASIIGDAYSSRKIHGSTPFSWMTLIGNKSDGTDMHSLTAKSIGISRDQAKVINYARIYGAGQKFAESLLKQFNPDMTDKEASLKSKKMFLMTKGQKLFRLKANFLANGLSNKLYSANETFKISQFFGKSRSEVFEKGEWIGGSESIMFNSLENIAHEKYPSTPFLNSRLSRALENETEKYLPTKVNWVVQSSAVDFLHLILVCMKWLMQDKARLCLSFHDEVRYLVPSKYKYNAALAMHVTNLLVRCFFVSRLNMKDLPMSVAFFTAVEVDYVLRKDSNQDYKTPSNPHGLKEGYGINCGESLNVWAAIEKSNGYVGISSTNS